MRHPKNHTATVGHNGDGRILTAAERREIVARLRQRAKQNPAVGLVLLALDLPAPHQPIPQVRA